jgi:cell division protein FtsQ
MARRAAATVLDLPAPTPKTAGKFLRTAQTILNWTAGICIAVFCLWAAWQIEHFIITDKRFVLEGPPEPGIRSEHFQIGGIMHASEQQITDVFSRDFGRSVYLCPVAERRRRLLAVDWVKEATVSRVWPNRILVHIGERTPVAFVQIPGPDESMLYGLVDSDGVMLDPQRASKLALPVIGGVLTAPKDEPKRRDQVKRFLRLQSELGMFMDKVSEIDVTEIENLKITQNFDGRALTLMLGNQQFLQRYRNFIDNYGEIRKRLPDAVVLDLRLKDRITAVVTAAEEKAAAAAQPVKAKESKRR